MAAVTTAEAPAGESTSPVAIVCVGMAGSGKTTFMQRINSHLHSQRKPPYVLNLDPAVHSVPFESNIDIRDSINYKEVMKQYNLGPNGGILTSLNLFATKVDQIIGLLEKRTAPVDPANSSGRPIKHILVDTPGQIEVFVWSASGSILLETLASSFPTVIAYVIDTPRTSSKDAEFAKEWMTDFDAFQTALRQEEDAGAFGAEGGSGGFGAGSGYMGSLLNSMSLMLEEFYRHLSVVAVSSMTGDGIDEFFIAVEEKRQEFERDYRPELERKKNERAEQATKRRDIELGKLMKDMAVSSRGKNELAETVSEAEEDPHGDDDAIGGDESDGSSGEEDSASADVGLASRYQQALADTSQGQTQPSDGDISFMRYIRASQPQ